MSHRNNEHRHRTVFSGFWHGPDLGALRRACLHSFVRMGHSFQLFTYQPLDVPDGVLLRDANEIIPFDEVFYYDNPETGTADIGPFSDVFRFKLLSERGGWWSDVDTICLSPDIPSVTSAWAQELPEKKGVHVGTSQIALPAKSSLSVELYERCLKLSRTTFSPREALGPRLISSVIRERGLPLDMFGRVDTFYPVRWIEMFKLWLPEFRNEVAQRTRSAVFLPIYQSFPQYIGLKLGKVPPPGSYLHEVCSATDSSVNSFERYLPEEIREGTREFFERHRWAARELREVAGEMTWVRLGLNTLRQPYTREYWAEVSKYARPAAEVIVPLVLELVRPRDVVDVGCGMGTWLRAFRDQGVEEICGIDGEWIDTAALEIPESSFVAADLERPLRLERRFDLVVSLEVAEHLAPASAERFVHSLTGLGEVVLFSAAVPGQGGVGHVNEQWPSYWARLFRREGYVALDPIRGRVWKDERVPSFYAQNTLIFCSEAALDRFPALAAVHLDDPPPLDIVHPEFFGWAHSRLEEDAEELARLQPRLEKARQRHVMDADKIARLQSRLERAEQQLASIKGNRRWRLRRRLAPIARIARRTRN
jgi:SAM-dependent methyltransferase